MNGSRRDGPRSVYLSLKAACLDCRIGVGPALGFFQRRGLHDKYAAEHAIVHEWARHQKLAFRMQPADVGHVLFLEFFASFFAQLWRVRRTLEQHEKVFLRRWLLRWSGRRIWFLNRRRIRRSRLGIPPRLGK